MRTLAWVAELAYAHGLGPCPARVESSNLSPGTKLINRTVDKIPRNT